jgi:hypothetical protein
VQNHVSDMNKDESGIYPAPPLQNFHKHESRRRTILTLILSGLGLILAVWWGIWAIMHNETGVLIVTSKPSGAEVILNHRPTDLLTSAFLSDLPADSFIVSLRMDGHRPIPAQQGVTIHPRDTTRVTFLLAPIARGDNRDLPPVSGKPHDWKWRSVRIHSNPEGAALVVDESELGVETPVTVLLEPGLHHVQVRWADGARGYKNIVISPSETQADITLQPATYEKPMRPGESR